ncbi:MAG: ParB/RepB/Spo0J family partition protein [Acidobacteria bacterium]|nr:ParB/RepB/Spo0J family partition protein [Acidobacteriota bacterium]
MKAARKAQSKIRKYDEMSVLQIIPSSTEIQARRRAKFTDDEISELAQSITANGLIQPITVRPAPGFIIEPGRKSNPKAKGMIDGFFWTHPTNKMFWAFSTSRKELEESPPMEIVAGERRFLAIQKAGFDKIDVVVRDLTDEQVWDIQIVENLQRKDVDIIDEAYSFKKLIDIGKYSIADLAVKLGRSEKYIKQRLRLNELIPKVLERVAKEQLPLGHAMEIAKFSPELQKKIYKNNAAYEWGEFGDEDYELLSLSNFKDVLRDEYLFSLATASFDTKDARLLPSGLICSACPERTGFEPLLFEEELQKGDSCLNEKCYEQKKLAFYQITRADAAKQLGVKDPKNIGFASERGFYDPEFKEKVHTWADLFESNECGKAKPVIDLGAETPGTIAYICEDSKCKKHGKTASDKDNGTADWQLKQNEERFQRDVATAVQRRILIESASFFTEKAFWSDKDLVDDLLWHLWKNNSYYLPDLMALWDKSAPRPDDSDKKVKKYLSGLDISKLSQMIFLALYCRRSVSGWQLADPAEILEINDRYTKLNYKLIDAEARVDLAPKEFKAKAKTYLKAVQSGEEIEPPSFWVKEEDNAKSDS